MSNGHASTSRRLKGASVIQIENSTTSLCWVIFGLSFVSFPLLYACTGTFALRATGEANSRPMRGTVGARTNYIVRGSGMRSIYQGDTNDSAPVKWRCTSGCRFSAVTVPSLRTNAAMASIAVVSVYRPTRQSRLTVHRSESISEPLSALLPPFATTGEWRS